MISVTSVSQAVVPVEVVQQPDGRWQLLRDGEPYFVNGVGGTERMEVLRAHGGNAMRTWGPDNLQEELDRAYQHGLTITAGIWLGHLRHGFDYGNPDQIAEQTEMVRRVVTEHHEHPALLLWSLGNEMEVGGNDNERLWRHINDLAEMVKEIDPNHPVMTVVAEISPQKIANIQEFAPAIDILGINSYGGMFSLPERVKEFGWEKPILITEFGPLGPWERSKTDWGAALEQTSSEKAASYREAYETVANGLSDQFLGSYAFLWGAKQETTPTWFGMFIGDEKTEAVDTMSQFWAGEAPAQQAPRISELTFSAAEANVGPGSTVSAEVTAADPDQDGLTYYWEVRTEVGETAFAGDGEVTPGVVLGMTELPRKPKVEFEVPLEPGAYRLYVYVRDGQGGIATANSPFLVE
jgi:hypothetical protein